MPWHIIRIARYVFPPLPEQATSGARCMPATHVLPFVVCLDPQGLSCHLQRLIRLALWPATDPGETNQPS